MRHILASGGRFRNVITATFASGMAFAGTHCEQDSLRAFQGNIDSDSHIVSQPSFGLASTHNSRGKSNNDDSINTLTLIGMSY